MEIVKGRFSILGFSERLSPWHKFLPYALLLSITFALYAATLFFGFVWDDYVYIVENYRIQELSLSHLRAIWTGTHLGHYAPMHNTLLAILYRLSGLNPFGYHLAQLLLHAACAGLLYLVLTRIESPRIALLSVLLFVVHPANIETVAWVAETKSTLAFLFFLLSFLAFLRWQGNERWRDLGWGALFLVLSVLSKINTVVAPAIFLLYDYWRGVPFHRKRIASLAALFLISAIFVAVHLASFQGSEGAAYGGLALHLQNLPFLVFFYLRMAIVPYPLSAWHLFRIYDHFTWVVGAGWIGLLGLLWMISRGNRRVQFWGLWFLIFLAPVLQIVPFPIWVAERYLYIPAIGAFVLASGVFFRVWDRLEGGWQRMGWEIAAGAVLLAYTGLTHAHLPVWKTDLALWEATTPTCPTSPYCRSSLGLALLHVGETERGVRELIQAVDLRPVPRYLIYLGDAFTLHVGDYRQALIAYNMALEQGGSSLDADFYAKLARVYLRTGRLDQARLAIEAGGKINSGEPSLLVMNGFLQWKEGNLEGARNALLRALSITGQTSHAAAFIFHEWGNTAELGPLLSDLQISPGNDR